MSDQSWVAIPHRYLERPNPERTWLCDLFHLAAWTSADGLLRGELRRSTTELAERWGIPRMTAYDFIRRLEAQGELIVGTIVHGSHRPPVMRLVHYLQPELMEAKTQQGLSRIVRDPKRTETVRSQVSASSPLTPYSPGGPRTEERTETPDSIGRARADVKSKNYGETTETAAPALSGGAPPASWGLIWRREMTAAEAYGAYAAQKLADDGIVAIYERYGWYLPRAHFVAEHVRFQEKLQEVGT
jgi:hypothetical protein